MDIKPDLKKQVYTLVGLASSVSILSAMIAVGLYKVDLLISRIEKLEDTIAINESIQNEKIAFFQTTIQSRTVMDNGQNKRLDRLEDAIFVPKPPEATKLEYRF